ncbi:MAG: hypothetical protein LW825_06020 [Candidatus Jidaibacter sp.]|jgi:hypothetical protein|nr:hypothetical protein [Candidatus Jidaibacter sp.]
MSISDTLGTFATMAASYATNNQNIFTAASVAGIAALTFLGNLAYGWATNTEVKEDAGTVARKAQSTSEIAMASLSSSGTVASIAAPFLFGATQFFHFDKLASACVGVALFSSVANTYYQKNRSRFQDNFLKAQETTKGLGAATFIGMVLGAAANAAIDYAQSR